MWGTCCRQVPGWEEAGGLLVAINNMHASQVGQRMVEQH